MKKNRKCSLKFFDGKNAFYGMAAVLKILQLEGDGIFCVDIKNKWINI